MSFQGVHDGNRDYVENDQVKTQVLANIERLQTLYAQLNPDSTDKSIQETEIQDLVKHVIQTFNEK